MYILEVNVIEYMTTDYIIYNVTACIDIYLIKWRTKIFGDFSIFVCLIAVHIHPQLYM